MTTNGPATNGPARGGTALPMAPSWTALLEARGGG